MIKMMNFGCKKFKEKRGGKWIEERILDRNQGRKLL